MNSPMPNATSQIFLGSTLTAISPCLMRAPGTVPTVSEAAQFLRSNVAAQTIADQFAQPGDLHAGHAMTRFYDQISSPPDHVAGLWQEALANLPQSPIETLNVPLTAIADAIEKSAAAFAADRMVDGLVTCVGGARGGSERAVQKDAPRVNAEARAQSKSANPDKSFDGAMSTDFWVKGVSDGLLGVAVGLSAYVKNAGNSAAALFANHFYHPSNPLFWLIPQETRETPLSNSAKEQILQWSGMPDFVRTPIVAIRYALMAARLAVLRKTAKENKSLPADRQKLFEMKVTGEALRATFTIVDFSAVMIASGLMQGNHWKAAGVSLAASHVARALTAVSNIATTPITFVDAKRAEVHNKEKAEAENRTYQPQTTPIVVRSTTLMGVGLTMLTTEAFVASAAFALWNSGGSINEMVATLKSSSVSMPLPVSLTLGSIQAMGAMYGVYLNAPRIGKSSGKERRAFFHGTWASALQAVASFAYAIPQYFAVGALMSAIASFGYWRQFSNKNAAKAQQTNPKAK